MPGDDRPDVKGLDKLTSIRLAEVLTQKGVVAAETITDALYIQDKYGEPFVDVLVGAGHIAEWDLARAVTESFQLPFILAGNLELSDDAKKRIPEEELFKHSLVPIGLFGNILTVSMPVLLTADVFQTLQTQHKVEIFPYVGLISENTKVLGDEFGNYKSWRAEWQKKKERMAAEVKKQEAARQASPQEEGDDSWADLFDSADAAVKDSLDK